MKKKKYIYVNNKPVEVSEKIYKAYWQEREKEKYQNKVYRKIIISLDTPLPNNEISLVEVILVRGSNPTKDKVLKLETYEELAEAIKQLTTEEQTLIKALYFDDYSQTDYAKKVGVSQQWISKKHKNIINKLKKLLK